MRHVTLIPDEDGVGYTVEVPSPPGCISEGDTAEEVLANTHEAIALFVESTEAHGEIVPEDQAIQVVRV